MGSGLAGGTWAAEAVARIHADGNGAAPTPLRALELPAFPGVEVWLKDESAHPTGSLKYRLVRALFCRAVARGALVAGAPVVAGTGGAVAVAGARFARVLGLPFTALAPERTPAAVLERIEAEGGRWRRAEGPPAGLHEEARQLAERQGAFLLDHFRDAGPAALHCGRPPSERATATAGRPATDGPAAGPVGDRPAAGGPVGDRPASEQPVDGQPVDDRPVDGRPVDGQPACDQPTLAAEVFDQLRHRPHPVPRWIVTGAGTGATSATVSRHLRDHGHGTRLAVVDPENSAYFPAWTYDAPDYATGMPSRIPGIGRPRTEPGFRPDLIDLVIPVPDAASVAALWWLRDAAGVAAGPATGTALWGTCHLLARMREAGEAGSVVAVLGDGADAYRATHLDAAWVRARGLDPAPFARVLARFLASGDPTDWQPARGR